MDLDEIEQSLRTRDSRRAARFIRPPATACRRWRRRARAYPGPGRQCRAAYVAAFDAARGGGAMTLDQWSERVLREIAAQVGRRAVFPFERPYAAVSALGDARRSLSCRRRWACLIHPDYGLWHGYRGALLFADAIKLPPPDRRASPCASCPDRPCLSACPAGAFDGKSYDVPACARHLVAAPEADLHGYRLSRAPCLPGRPRLPLCAGAGAFSYERVPGKSSSRRAPPDRQAGLNCASGWFKILVRSSASMKRRTFLLGSAGAAGALVVGWSSLPPRQRLTTAQPLPCAKGRRRSTAGSRSAADDSVTVIMSQARDGTGRAHRPGHAAGRGTRRRLGAGADRAAAHRRHLQQPGRRRRRPALPPGRRRRDQAQWRPG